MFVRTVVRTERGIANASHGSAPAPDSPCRVRVASGWLSWSGWGHVSASRHPPKGTERRWRLGQSFCLRPGPGEATRWRPRADEPGRAPLPALHRAPPRSGCWAVLQSPGFSVTWARARLCWRPWVAFPQVQPLGVHRLRRRTRGTWADARRVSAAGPPPGDTAPPTAAGGAGGRGRDRASAGRPPATSPPASFGFAV